jgi:hypothetical protein
MRVVVNDANILIDLVELDLLPAFFALGFEMATSAVVFDELVMQAILVPREAAIKLRLLCDSINPRLGLPVGEVEKRLDSWEGGDKVVG